MNNEINPSFKSKINIVTLQDFRKLRKGTFIDFEEKDILSSRSFHTYGVRTCTAGGLISKAKKAIGFHIWSEKVDLSDTISELKKDTNHRYTNGLLIGAKDLLDAQNSIVNFEILQRTMEEILGDFSYFKIFKKMYSEANLQYSKKKDCWNIFLRYKPTPLLDEFNEITDLKSLLKMFDEIHIAPGDKLFINGKQITKKDAPQIFAQPKKKKYVHDENKTKQSEYKLPLLSRLFSKIYRWIYDGSNNYQ